MTHPSIEADIRRLRRRRIISFKPFVWIVDFFPLQTGNKFFPERIPTEDMAVDPQHKYDHLNLLISCGAISSIIGLAVCAPATLLPSSLVDPAIQNTLIFTLFVAPTLSWLALFLVLRFNAPATRRYVEFFSERAQDGDRYAEIAVDWVTKRGYLARRDAELLLLAMERAEKVKSKASVVRRVIQRLNVANQTNRKARLTVLMGTALEAHAQARGLDQVTSTAGGETKPARRL